MRMDFSMEQDLDTLNDDIENIGQRGLKKPSRKLSFK